jgi:hypothetical protein
MWSLEARSRYLGFWEYMFRILVSVWTAAYRHTVYYFVIYTDKKENDIFLIYREIQMGSVAKSYTRKGFLIYVEMHKYLTI